MSIVANYEAEGRPTKRTPSKKELFLGAVAEGKSIAASARIAGIARSIVYDWRATDPEFAKEWADAVETGTDALEDLARKQAKVTPVMTMFLLKARRPEIYKERVYNEHTGKDGGPIQSEDVTSAGDELLSRIAAIAERAGSRPRDTKLN
jgi:hypothetical protein